jgi:hypothetical protein
MKQNRDSAGKSSDNYQDQKHDPYAARLSAKNGSDVVFAVFVGIVVVDRGFNFMHEHRLNGFLLRRQNREDPVQVRDFDEFTHVRRNSENDKKSLSTRAQRVRAQQGTQA